MLIEESVQGYIFSWSGRIKEERREAGVGFAIKSHNLSARSQDFRKALKDKLMKLRLPLSSKRFATIVSAYAPIMTNPNEVKGKLYI